MRPPMAGGWACAVTASVKKTLSVVHVIGTLTNRSGGPARTVPPLCEALAEDDTRISVVTLQASVERLPDASRVQTCVLRAFRLRGARVPYAPRLQRRLLDHCRQAQADVVHSHGLWLPLNHAASVAARRLGVPLLISPHGMLEGWSLRYHALRKRLALALYQHRDLRLARALHAASAQEAAGLQRLGLEKDIAVAGHGVDLPVLDPRQSREQQPHVALFVGRIHPKKGLLNLVRAWESLRPSAWRMVVAGPDEVGHRAVVESAIAEAGLERSFTLTGAIDDHTKDALLRQADLFVLPTHSESFGQAVAEALAYGVPVITTREAPWQALETHGSGWWVDVGVAPLARALDEAFALSGAERRAMGARGRRYVAQNLRWNDAATRMRAVYRWLVNQGARPDFVLPG